MVSKRLIVDYARESILDKMLSDNYGDNMRVIKGEQYSEIFIDRDPALFSKLISYLRSDMKVYPEFDSPQEEIAFANELDYWGLPASDEFIEKDLVARLPKKLVEHLKTEPIKLKPDTLATWRELGPIRLVDIMKHATNDNPIQFGNDSFGCSS